MISTHKGEKFITTEGYAIEVIEYFNFKNCTIKLDNGLVMKNINFNPIKKGNIKNPFHKSIFGVGFYGFGKYFTKLGGKRTPYYEIWVGMLKRCYSEKHRNKFPTYKDCAVDKRWHNFQVFAEWFEENYIEGFQLDKDILVKGSKIYSPETCCFVPQDINKLLIKSDVSRGQYPIGVFKLGNNYIAQISKNINVSKHLGSYKTPEEAFQAYKEAKEQYIKEVANKWRGRIIEKVYQALIDYKVEITD